MTSPTPPAHRLDAAPAEPLRNGYYVLPRGKLANFCVYLEMFAPAKPPVPPPVPQGVRMEPLEGRDAERYQTLFRAVGEPWLWAGHIAKSRDEIAAILDAPGIETWAIVSDAAARDIGVLQLGHDDETGTELLYFGLVPDAIGQGLGRWLLQTAQAHAFAKGARRFWLHTCNFDHPNAIAFYQRAGLKICATGFEVMDDPRVSGLLPETAAPHVPLVP